MVTSAQVATAPKTVSQIMYGASPLRYPINIQAGFASKAFTTPSPKL